MKRFMKNRKKLFALSVMMALTAGIVGTTAAAYVSPTELAANTFTAGNVTTEIEEEIRTGTDTTIQKKARVKNTGKNAAVVRVRVTISPASQEANLTINYDMDNWTREADGFYYYKGVIAPGTCTSDLFSSIEMKDTNAYEDFDITLYQEAIQADKSWGEMSEIEYVK